MDDIKIIRNAQVVLENGILWDGAIIIQNGRIAQVAKEKDVDCVIGAKVLDAGGAYVGPGFVDIHVHGGNGFSTCLQAEKAAEHFLQHGETSILATPDYIMDFSQMMEAITATKAAMKTNRTLKGLYMEGPFTSPKYGAMADLNPWRKFITADEYKPLVDAGGNDVKVWAIAPEREDVLPFLKYARKVNPEVRFAIGHSEATPMQIRALGKYRPSIQTHSMNATGRLPVYGGTRGYGPDEYCFKEPDVFTELISDSLGIHVHPEMQQLLLHNKGVHRTVLITDSTTDNDPNPPSLAHVKDLNFDHNGGLSGSKMTMDMACKNIMTHTNCGIAQAFIMASTAPARAIGMDDEIGSIEVGKAADFVFVNDRFHVQNVIVSGKMVF